MNRPGLRSVVLLVALTVVLTAMPGGVAADAPADPDEDTIGWEAGYWYNESVSVTRGDGLNETELDAVVSRSMARVEVVRQLEFEARVPVEVISREAYREQLGSQIANTSAEQAMHTKVVLEAMLMLGESESALAAQESTLGSSVLGQYDPATQQIQIVSENASTPKMNEITLSQELFHALQDQHFDLGMDSRNTTDGLLANNGIVEGDGNLVDYRYQQRCSAEWDCLLPTASSGSGGGGDIHYGYQLTLFQPYSDGPPFVQGIVESEGWAGVNDVYDQRPTSSEQVIHPEKYPSEQPVTVSLPDRSSAEWRILDVPNVSVNYDTVGEAGMAVMQLYPFWDSNQTERIQRVQSFLNTQGGSANPLDPYNYTFVESAGWGGDRIYPYVRDGSFESNETGYVWRTTWDTAEDADEFLRGYYELLAYYGASPVEGRLGTFRIPSGNDLNDAFYVNHTGQTVTIVNAPSVAALANVRAGAAPSGERDLSDTPWAQDGSGSTPTTTPPTEDPTPTDTDGPTATDTDEPATTATTAADGPGFGALVALVSLLLVALFGVFCRD